MARERTIVQVLARRARELRERQGLSQADVARLSGLTRTQVLMLERGEQAARIVTVDAVARALGVTASELLRPTTAANPGPDRADRVAGRLRALGTEALETAEKMAEAMEHLAASRGRRRG